MEIKTVKQLLEEAESQRKKDRVDQFVELLIQDTLSRKLHWITTDPKTVTASFGDRFGIEVEEEQTYADEAETICDGAVYRLSLYAFGVGTDRQIISIETGFPNTLGNLYELACRQKNKLYASAFGMIEEYFENAKREEAVDMLVKLYDALKKQ